MTLLRPLRPTFLAAAMLALAVPAVAQDARNVARVQAGASCPGCNLFQAPLANASLRGRDLRRARLRQADVSAAVMTRARLRGADLRDLNAYGAVMTGADLSGADLTHASLVGAYLQGADLARARLEGANLSGAEMSRARGLTRAQLARACGDPSTTLRLVFPRRRAARKFGPARRAQSSRMTANSRGLRSFKWRGASATRISEA